MAQPAKLRALALVALPALLSVLAPEAQACGGFFCGQAPVDQTAERILFEVGEDSVTMTTQISFSGRAEDFAWILPLSAVPDPDSLAEFPQQALTALDANTGPIFNPPQDPACYAYDECAGCVQSLASTPDASESEVTVQIRTVVGNYDVAVIESEDPEALIDWLRENDYRITRPMEPYIERYTAEGMKFLALKLIDTADVSDIKPFRFTLPGTAPSIPLRMTALAAEPEMSILVFVLGQQRYEGKNWANLEIRDDEIRFNPFSPGFTAQTNWTRLVAQAADAAGGQGWVTEFAGPTAPYADQVRQQLSNGFLAEDFVPAATELLGVLEAHPYMTRLYTRLSAEEMTSDPVLGASALGDVDRARQLSRIVDGVDQCAADARVSTDPCDFATCGAAGFCRAVPIGGGASTNFGTTVAGCACLPGATARPTFGPDGSPTVICQDGRLSFLNPGERATEGEDVLPDPCAGVNCGNGQCAAMNLTATCVCDQGFVAVSTSAIGASTPTLSGAARGVTCMRPSELVPASFYDGRLPALPDDLPGGREVAIVEPALMPAAEPSPEPPSTVPPPPSASFPMPRQNPELARASSSGGGGCSISLAASGGGSLGWAAALALVALRRRTRAKAA